MATDPKLEAYLTVLDKVLAPIPVSDRADILTEIKSHIMDAQERNPEKSMHDILSSLGEPETVANRYLLERGLKTARPPRAPIVKWLTIGFLGTVGLVCLTTLILIYKFSPLVSISEEDDRVVLLGGLIDIDGGKGTLKVNGMVVDDEEIGALEFAGEQAPKTQSIEFHVPFSNGKLTLRASQDEKVHWRCKMVGAKEKHVVNGQVQQPHTVAEAEGKMTLDLKGAIGAKCEISVPAKMRSVVNGANGKILLVKPQAPVDISVSNGKVSILEDVTKKYRFDLSVSNGKVGKFKSSDTADAIAIKVALANGKISPADADEVNEDEF